MVDVRKGVIIIKFDNGTVVRWHPVLRVAENETTGERFDVKQADLFVEKLNEFRTGDTENCSFNNRVPTGISTKGQTNDFIGSQGYYCGSAFSNGYRSLRAIIGGMKQPEFITLYSGEQHTVVSSVWEHCLADAIKWKEWADKVMGDKDLQKQMCQLSLEEAQKDSKLTVVEIAINTYRYFYYRAHLRCVGRWSDDVAVDPQALHLWEKLVLGDTNVGEAV